MDHELLSLCYWMSFKPWIKRILKCSKLTVFLHCGTRTEWTANRLAVHPGWITPLVRILRWTATANGHQLLGWTATNFWGERPRTSGVNGHELLGWTATNLWGERPRVQGWTKTFEVNGHGLLWWMAMNFWGERPRVQGWTKTFEVNGHQF